MQIIKPKFTEQLLFSINYVNYSLELTPENDLDSNSERIR